MPSPTITSTPPNTDPTTARSRQFEFSRLFLHAALAVAAVNGQRGRASTGYGAPQAAPAPAQAQYGQPQTQSQSLADSQQGSHDHQGLDWLLESVPGQPGTDYPIYSDANQFDFDCSGQVEGGKLDEKTFYVPFRHCPRTFEFQAD